MNKQGLTWLIIVIIIAVAGAAFLWWLYSRPADDSGTDSAQTENRQEEEIMPGSDRDEHGCIPSAGYVWCEEKQKCLRPWEEECVPGENSEGEDPSAAIPDDDRILLTNANTTQYCDPEVDLASCQAEEFNTEAATTTVNYTDQARGISVNIPYNPDWGSANYKIEPYEVDGDYVYFGPMTQFEGGGWSRPYWLLGFVPPKSADQLITEINDSPDTLAGGQPEKIDINGLEVVKYQEMGLGTHYMMEVAGDKYNYRFVASSFGDEPEDVWTNLTNIVQSVQLI